MTIKEKLEQATPAVNMNGNSKASLVDEWCDFADAITSAMEQFPHESFNGRNHQTLNPEDRNKVIQAKIDILQQLRDLMDGSNEMAERIHNQ